MANCSRCGWMILFGGVEADGIVFCGPACRDDYAISVNLPKAEHAYRAALDALRKAPANPDVKQRALDAGRAYASWTREGSEVTVFDEVALANDIQAASAAASVSPTSASGGLSVEQRLERLGSLRKRSLISDAEYDVKRQEILAEL